MYVATRAAPQILEANKKYEWRRGREIIVCVLEARCWMPPELAKSRFPEYKR